MANELTLSATITYTDDRGRTRAVSVPDFLASTTELTVVEQVIPTSATAINLGGVSSPTAVMIVNEDPTNFVNLLVANSGAIFAKLVPDANADGNGGFVMMSCAGSGAQAPYAQADTASCKVLVVIAE